MLWIGEIIIPVNGIPFITAGVDLRFHDIDHSGPET